MLETFQSFYKMFILYLISRFLVILTGKNRENAVYSILPEVESNIYILQKSGLILKDVNRFKVTQKVRESRIKFRL